MLDFLYYENGIVTVNDGEITTLDIGHQVTLWFEGKEMFQWINTKLDFFSTEFKVEDFHDEIVWLNNLAESFAIPLTLNPDREYRQYGFLPAIRKVWFKESNHSYHRMIEVDSRALQIWPAILDPTEEECVDK